MRRAFEHPLAPVLGCALVCVVYLLARPATADMAAHSYRAWLFQHEGLTVWNAQWYGGHHVLGLLAAVRAAGGRDRARATWACSPRSRRSRCSPRSPARPRRRRPRARPRRGCSTAGVLSNVVIGRMPFLLGIALTVGAWSAGTRRSGASSPACSRWRAMLASPVAGVFLMLGAAAKLSPTGRRRSAGAVARRCPRSAGGVGLYLLFPEGGTDRFTATAFWPMLVISAAGVALLAPGRRTLWAGGLLYLACWSRRSSCRRRSGRTRCGSACWPGRRVLALRAPQARRRSSRWPSSASGCCTCSGCPRCAPWPRRMATRRTRLAFQAEARDFLAARGQAGRARRGADDAQPLGGRGPAPRSFRSRAGGSASSTRRPTRSSTTDEPLTASALPRAGCARTRSAGWRCRTRRWTTRRATSGRCSSAGPSSSSSAYESPRWRIWEVQGTDPPASNGAKLLAAGPNWFMVDAAKTDRRALPLHEVLVDERRLPGARRRGLDRGRTAQRRRGRSSSRPSSDWSEADDAKGC